MNRKLSQFIMTTLKRNIKKWTIKWNNFYWTRKIYKLQEDLLDLYQDGNLYCETGMEGEATWLLGKMTICIQSSKIR